MPYQSCPACGLRTYCVSGEECPRCGTPLDGVRRASDAAPGWRADSEAHGAVERVLAVARRELRMDVAMLTEVRDGREEVRWVVGNGRMPAFVAGAGVPLDDTICKRLLDGTIAGVVPDAAADAVLRDLPVVRGTGLRAYIGVPVSGAALARYVLCCLALEARPDLSEADLRFVRGLVESVRSAVERTGA